MLGWFQELGARGPASESTYSGCLTLPRVLSRRGAPLRPPDPTADHCALHKCYLSPELASRLRRCMALYLTMLLSNCTRYLQTLKGERLARSGCDHCR
jgi:hypothetical protein